MMLVRFDGSRCDDDDNNNSNMIRTGQDLHNVQVVTSSSQSRKHINM